MDEMETTGTPEIDTAAEIAETESAPEQKKPRRGGRKPYTEEQKAEAARKRAEKKAQAENLTPVVLVQYQDAEADVNALVEAAKSDFKAVKKRTRITALNLYIKPEERAAYYVVNGDFNGKVSF
ncbi:MAG: hypothetical protein IJT94_12445 [Oscillibacter sp.]|nr:hypothetical protein [Oscillibacter sp.]